MAHYKPSKKNQKKIFNSSYIDFCHFDLTAVSTWPYSHYWSKLDVLDQVYPVIVLPVQMAKYKTCQTWKLLLFAPLLDFAFLLSQLSWPDPTCTNDPYQTYWIRSTLFSPSWSKQPTISPAKKMKKNFLIAPFAFLTSQQSRPDPTLTNGPNQPYWIRSTLFLPSPSKRSTISPENTVKNISETNILNFAFLTSQQSQPDPSLTNGPNQQYWIRSTLFLPSQSKRPTISPENTGKKYSNWYIDFCFSDLTAVLTWPYPH